MDGGEDLIALRLSLVGEGEIGAFSIEAVTGSEMLASGTDDEVAPLEDVTRQVHQLVQSHFLKRNHTHVVELQRDPFFQTDYVNRLAFVSLVELREFSAALRFHRQWAPSAGDDDGTWERRYLEALASLDRWAAAEKRIGAHLAMRKNESLVASTALKLTEGFAYARNNEGLRAQIVDRLSASELPSPIVAPGLVDIAARASDGRYGEPGFQLLAKVLSDPRTPQPERLMLESQAAFARLDHACQIDRLNQVLAAHSLATLRTVGTQEIRISGLTASRDLPAVSGNLVSVVMTSYNSEETITYAIRSLLDQSWRNLELLLVDDASGDQTISRALDAAGGDDRLRIIQAPQNQGTYACRNLGLRSSRGEMIVNQDSDDWAHPQKIERLAAALNETDAIASIARGIRLSEGRGFLSRRGFLRLDGTSLLFRREALDRMEGYEERRFGADGEFHRRLEREFGRESIIELADPLSIIAARPLSLSRGSASGIDEDTGVFPPARNAYRRQYLLRHEAAYGPRP